jgi:tryptophan-rich sensory protein
MKLMKLMNSTPSTHSPLRQFIGLLWLDRAMLFSGGLGRLCFDGRLVCGSAEAVMESASMGFRPGMDHSVSHDATAAWLVWREGGWKQQGRALTLFLVQWLLNALWTPLFLGRIKRAWHLRRSFFSG